MSSKRVSDILMELSRKDYGDPTLGLTAEEFEMLTEYDVCASSYYPEDWIDLHDRTASDFMAIWDSAIGKLRDAGRDDLAHGCTPQMVDGALRLMWNER